MGNSFKLNWLPAAGLLLLGAPSGAWGYTKGSEKETTDKKVKIGEGEKGKPALEYNTFRFQVELQVASQRDAAIKYLKKILGMKPSEKERPDLLFRLAELYYEKSRDYFFQAHKLDDQRAALKGDKVKLAGLDEQKAKFLKTSNDYGSEALKLYEEIIKKYEKYERMDEVLFFTALTRWDMGDRKTALNYYRSILKDFKDSRFVPDSFLAFGEFYFDEALLDKALEAYGKVLPYKQSKAYGFALYKMGWCYYNLAAWDKAMENFEAVIYYSDLSQEVNKENRIALRGEAMKDYVLTFSHSGSADEAPAVFQKVMGKKDWPRMLGQLAKLYFDFGKNKEAIIVYRQLIKNTGDLLEKTFYQGRIVELAARIGNKRYTVKQTRELVEKFREARKVKAQASAASQEKLQEAEVLAEQTLKKLATEFHNEAKKTREDETFNMANELYSDYLAAFPNGPDAYNLRFYLAELLFAIEKFERSAEQYSRVIQQDPKGKFTRDAALNAVLAFEEIVKRAGQDTESKKKRPDDTEKQALGPMLQQYIAVGEQYLHYVPEGSEAANVKYRIAYTFYAHNYFEEALKYFLVVVKDHPKDKLAVTAANLILDTYNLLKDYDRLLAVSRKFRDDADLGDPEFKKLVQAIIEQTTFNRVGAWEKQGEYEKAGQGFVDFTKEFPASELADKALANAAADFFKANKFTEALQAREVLVNNYSKSPLVPAMILATGSAYERMVDFEKAAEYFELYARKYPKGPPPESTARDAPKEGKKEGKKEAAKSGETTGEGPFGGADVALRNAALYREGLRQFSKSIEDRLIYIKMYPKNSDVHQVAYTIGGVYEKMNDPQKAAKAYRDFINQYPRYVDYVLEAHLKIARLEKKEKDADASRSTCQRILSLYDNVKRQKLPVEQKERARRAAGAARFSLAEEGYRNFKTITLTGSADTLKRKLKQKLDLLPKVKEEYSEVVGIQSPEWVVAALFRMGDLYREFAKALMEAPVPPELDEASKTLYTEFLRQKALPIEDKAVEAYLECIKQSQRLDEYNSWVIRAMGALHELRPEEYQPNYEVVSTPGLYATDDTNFSLVHLPNAPAAKKAGVK